MLLYRLLQLCLFYVLSTPAASRLQHGLLQRPLEMKSGGLLQANVTWDEQSLFVNGQRVLIYSGEFHPFRLPVPTLWLDILQKVRSLGYTAVSFYVDWALVEGKQGEIKLDGVFALEPFFVAAEQAGIYLIARPGPYINAEVSGGGFPGWLQRIKGHVRTADKDFLDATDLYVKTVCEVIAKAQITNGGPVILVQPENEYSHWIDGFENDPKYFKYVEKQFRDAGIVVPLITNDAGPDGNNVPGSAAAYDIYGHDGYPLGFDCSNPDVWPEGALPTDWWTLHQQQSPSTPYTIPEFQGGSFDPWSGLGFDKCLALTGPEFLRVFWKNLYSFGVTIYNVYMIYGGTNWGNMGHPNGYTSYDYGAAIGEDRSVAREKYSEAKIQAYFLASSPAYLSAKSSPPQAGNFVSTKALTVTHLQSDATQFFVVRHTDYATKDTTTYQLSIPNTKIGPLTIPQGNHSLALLGRDSKIFVANYDLCNRATLIYSTAEVLTIKMIGQECDLMLYGDDDQWNELALDIVSRRPLSTGEDVTITSKDDYTLVNFKTGAKDQVVRLDGLTVWLIGRQSAYSTWVLDTVDPTTGNVPYAGQAKHTVIVKGGWLMRSALAHGQVLKLTGDINITTTAQIIGAPQPLEALIFNDDEVDFVQDEHGVVTAELLYEKPVLALPDLSTQSWSYSDSLTEISKNYSDAAWPLADVTSSNNTNRQVSTPTSLYSGDYGFHAGTLLYRGHFEATGEEKSFSITAQGGEAFGFSVWLDDRFLGSWIGDNNAAKNVTFDLPKLEAAEAVFTVVIDNMGYDENYIIGEDWMKGPRGILDYSLDGHQPDDIRWKVTGNLGGEDYADKVRGPLNEGGMWAERHGLHLPTKGARPGFEGEFVAQGPMKGISKAGIAWYTTTFDLDIPEGYDVPLAIELPAINKSASATYRAQIYVNGWQFGKYVHHLGPQIMYIVPQGIWNYQGENTLAISLWAMNDSGAKLDSIKLVAGPNVQTGYRGIETVKTPLWSPRPGVY